MAKYAIIKTFLASKPWINFRLSLIAERGNKCEKCKAIIAKAIEIIGHHKIELTPENVQDHHISLNPDNVELWCRGCHEGHHDRFGHKAERKVYIVFGMPLSGKTSYVMQNKSRYDIVLDIDKLYQAITLLPEHDKPDRLLSIVRGVYNQLIDNVKVRYGKWNNAYIVGGFADKYKRERLADDLGAEVIYCEISKDEAIARIDVDEHRQYMKAEYIQYINKWCEEYTE